MKDRDRRRDRRKANELRRNRVGREPEISHDAHLWRKDRRKQRQFKRTVLLLIIPAMLAGAACGGASNAREGDGAKAGPRESSETSKEEQKAFLDFAKCMREHGVDMPDPEFKGSGEVAGIKMGGPDLAPGEMEDAQKACRKHLPPSASGEAPGLSEEEQDAFLAFARCMRENGVNVPDPKPEDGGLFFRVGDPDAPNPESADFKEAEKHCRKHLAPVDRKIGRQRT